MKYTIKSRNSSEVFYAYSPRTASFLYETKFGRLFLPLVTCKTVSDLVGKYYNSSFSKHKIKRIVKKNNIDLSLYEKDEFDSYNDYFTRKLKEINVNKDKEIFISPCDSKLSVYKINSDLTLKIKDSYYSIDTLVEKNILNDYIDGYALVFRLDVTDYHRYCYIDSGMQKENNHIKGIYHTVQPISLKNYNFYKTNSREWTILQTSNFDDVIDIEIGALCVGKIHNHHENYNFKKGEEKGYFEFGGSTIVLLVKKNILFIDKDILSNSNNNIETIVKYGEEIGIKK